MHGSPARRVKWDMWKPRRQQLGAKQGGIRQGEHRSRPRPVGARGGREGGGLGQRGQRRPGGGGQRSSDELMTKACPVGAPGAAMGRAKWRQRMWWGRGPQGARRLPPTC
jgi:hypothetical protein